MKYTKLKYRVSENGTKQYLNDKNEPHRLDGPAIEYPNGDKEWYQNGKLHRVDGPAIEYANGNKYWCQNGKYHREDGPALEWADGNKYWYQNNKFHRLDGPAVEHANGNKSYWINNKFLTKKEFDSHHQKDDYEGKEIVIEGIKYVLYKKI